MLPMNRVKMLIAAVLVVTALFGSQIVADEMGISSVSQAYACSTSGAGGDC